ncbi:MAG TPA: energy transducer TonB [Candidatus Angelobacter sp.]|jgi:protein TonB|nr:energy transducer TonB [Candidatus Angelobacter sp.]
MAKRQFLAVLACAALAVLVAAQTEPAKQPSRLKVSSGVAEGLKTHTVNPIYPPAARNAGIQGDVILQATIDTKGHITNIRAVQGDPILVKASIDAVKEWRYRPYVFNGEPVQVETTIKVRFRL